jgi:bacillopeptidase F (M6 metalloprotease family)
VVNDVAARTRIQIHDASFSFRKMKPKTLTLNGVATELKGWPEPLFRDSRSYWDELAPHAGLILPKYGLNIAVLNASRDFTVGRIYLSKW